MYRLLVREHHHQRASRRNQSLPAGHWSCWRTMECMALVTPANLIAALLTLIPFLFVAFLPQFAASRVRALPTAAQLASPALLCIPYVLVTCAAGFFRWQWL